MKILEKITKIKNNNSKVFNAGKQAEYDTFWGAIQSNGTRTDYRRAFCGVGWGNNSFKPKYDMRPVGDANNMFWASLIGDIVKILDECGVKLDTSKATNMQYFFGGCGYLTTAPEISLVSLLNKAHANYLFNLCRRLISIENLILKDDGSLLLDGAFEQCNALEYIRIEGVIGENFNVRWSPLSRESFIGEEITEEKYNTLSEAVKTNNVYIKDGKYYYGGVITALSPTTTGKTVSFSKTAKEAAFTDEEWIALTATKSNWTFNLV